MNANVIQNLKAPKMANYQKPEEEQEFAHPVIKEYNGLFCPFLPEKISPFKNIEEMQSALKNEEVRRLVCINLLFYCFLLVKIRKFQHIDFTTLREKYSSAYMSAENKENGIEQLIFLSSILIDLFYKEMTDSELRMIFEDGRLKDTYPQVKALLIFTERAIEKEKMRMEKEKKKNR